MPTRAIDAGSTTDWSAPRSPNSRRISRGCATTPITCLSRGRAALTKRISVRRLARSDWQRALAELIGTFGLVFAGTGAIVIDAETGGAVGHIGVGLTFGLIVMTMIYATGHISGAHLNPAVTLA